MSDFAWNMPPAQAVLYRERTQVLFELIVIFDRQSFILAKYLALKFC